MNCIRRFPERVLILFVALRLSLRLLPAMYFSRLFQGNVTDMKMDELAGLRINPILNKIFEWFLLFELVLIRVGISLPIGGSRLLVARRQF